MVVKIVRKKGGGILFCIVLLITKCMRVEINEDEKLLIDLEWPNKRSAEMDLTLRHKMLYLWLLSFRS